MTEETPNLTTLALRLDAIVDRLDNLEIQARALMLSQTVEAKVFVVTDERGEVRARLEMQEYSPRLTFFDRVGEESLKIGLRADGTPAMWLKGRETPLTAA